MFDREKAEKHLKQLLKKYNIKVRKYRVSASGRAYPSISEVEIPKPTDVERFCVCMHEIKHVIDGFWGKLYQREYFCEMFAITEAKKLGFDVTDYTERARRYVIVNVAKGYCRGLNLKNIEKDVVDFCKVDFSQWHCKNVFVRRNKTNKPMEIVFKDKK